MADIRLSQQTDWLVPQWPAPNHVRAVFTTRAGGVSKAPFDSLNPALHVGDSAADVMQNRAILRDALGASPVYLSQVHGTRVVRLTTDGPVIRFERKPLAGNGVADQSDFQDEAQADGCWTQTPGALCSIMVADCLPVLLSNRSGDFVAAAHAGWRGLAGSGSVGILESLLESVLAKSASKTPAPQLNTVIAWLGPCIGATKFEVGDEVRTAFVARDAQAALMFKPVTGSGATKWLADLQGLARQRLIAAGVTQIDGNDGSLPWCTVSNPSNYFSHRRDSLALGSSGRMVACVWLDWRCA